MLHNLRPPGTLPRVLRRALSFVGALASTFLGSLCTPHAALADELTHVLRPDAAFIQLGRSIDGSDTLAATAGLAYEWRSLARMLDYRQLSTYGEVSIGSWKTNRPREHASTNVTQIGFTPVWRWYQNGEAGWFAEGAIGVNLITPIYHGKDKSFSTVFNFGDHVGVGWRSESPAHDEWVLRLQHFSNAGFREPNPGVNFMQLRYLRPL